MAPVQIETTQPVVNLDQKDKSDIPGKSNISDQKHKHNISDKTVDSMKSDQSDTPKKKDKNSALPNFHSCLLICSIFCAHVLHNVRASGVLGTASVDKSGTDASCVSKYGSVFPFCLPDVNHVDLSDSMIKMLAVAVVFSVAIAVLVQSSSFQSCSKVDKKQKNYVLPNFHSVLLVCGIFIAHVVNNVQNDSTLLLSGGIVKMLPGIGFLLVSLIVGALWMQTSSTSKTEKVSVLPNPYSVMLICCVLCAHVVHNQPENILSTASVLAPESIVKMLPGIGFLLVSLVVGALWMQSNSTSKTNKVSVLPNSYSVMLICCVLCAHFVYNRPQNTDIGIAEASTSIILGHSSAIRSFGEKDHAVEDIPAKMLDSILEKEQAAWDSIVGKSKEAGSTSSDAYYAQHSEVMSKASPKAILASVLFAFVAMTLKTATNSNDKKSKPSVLPNSRSVLLICCIFFGHFAYNLPPSYSEHRPQVSVYTGVDEVASWDEYGSVLPDTAEDMDSLLEATSDMLTAP